MWGLFKPMRGRYKRGRDACLLKHRKDLFHPRGTTMVFPCSDMDTWCPWNCDVHRRTSSSFMAPEHFSPSETWISPMFHHCCISERKRHYLLSHCWDHEKLSVLFRHLACFHALAMMEKWEMFSAWMVTGVSSPQSWACLWVFNFFIPPEAEDEQPDCSAKTSWEAEPADASLLGDIIICKQFSPHH